MANILGDYTSSRGKRINSLVEKVNAKRSECVSITDDKTLVNVEYNGSLTRMSREKSVFVSKTNEFRRRLRNGEKIEDILVEALALVREATKRVLHMEPYDVQIEAAIAMIGDNLGKDKNGNSIHERVIAEMKTGEGKTLVQILVAYLNVLEATKDEDPSKWKNVHIMTSNDALAKRDATANGRVFDLLGISCGFVPSRRSVKGASLAEKAIYKHKKQQSYRCDIVYAMPSTIAFDYLEDNTVYQAKDRNITKGFSYAIVDEADDVLIDQAINPLRLSGSSLDTSEYAMYLLERDELRRKVYKWATEFLYGKAGVRNKPLVSKIYDRMPSSKRKDRADYTYIKSTKEVTLSQDILDEIDNGEDDYMYNLKFVALIDCIKAKEGFTNGVEYNVEYDKETGTADIILIDQNIGRKKYANKYTNGIQEAIEAKEQYLEQDSPNAKKRYNINFTVTHATKALCTYPDFLSLYERTVSGMTGTSDEKEFQVLYGFQTYRVKTRKRNIRIDEQDELYATLKEKLNAIVEEVVRCNEQGIPVLIGTTSLNESILLSSMLAKKCIRHRVLNANNEEEENEIIANAGLYGAVTVATNMAGRGTDIKLGPGVRELGGLYVIGTSKNKSRRIDLQLRGRSGRQGDPGKTKYYSSLEDDLIKEHYRDKEMSGIIELLRDTGKPIKNKRIIKTADKCQKIKETQDKKTRINTERFHKSFMEHRRIIYKLRNKILDANPKEFMTFIKNILVYYVNQLVDENDVIFIKAVVGHLVDVDKAFSEDKGEFKDNLINGIYARFRSNFKEKGNTPIDVMDYINAVRINLLYVIDIYWVEHIQALENLKGMVTIGTIGDPFMEYENRANEMFAKKLIPAIYNEIITYACNKLLRYGEYQINYVESEAEQAKL